MDASDLAEFNAAKMAVNSALWPAEVEFINAATGIKYGAGQGVSFGETANDGSLHASGQAIENHRLGILYFPVTVVPPFTPALLQLFKVTGGQTWQILDIVSAAGEFVRKFKCVQSQP